MHLKEIISFSLVSLLAISLSSCVKREISCIGTMNRIIYEQIVRTEESKKFAVLINGSNEARHRNNILKAYNMLLSQDFERDYIFVLDSEGYSKDYRVDDIATKESISTLLNYVRCKVKKEDLLFIYCTGHGGKRKNIFKKNEATLSLHEENISVSEFDAIIRQLNECPGIIVYDQCYSGNFAKVTGHGNFIAVSATSPERLTNLDTFADAFFQSWQNSKADANGDGKISLYESIKDTKTNDILTQLGSNIPQIIYDNLDPKKIFLK